VLRHCLQVVIASCVVHTGSCGCVIDIDDFFAHRIADIFLVSFHRLADLNLFDDTRRLGDGNRFLHDGNAQDFFACAHNLFARLQVAVDGVTRDNDFFARHFDRHVDLLGHDMLGNLDLAGLLHAFLHVQLLFDNGTTMRSAV